MADEMLAACYLYQEDLVDEDELLLLAGEQEGTAPVFQYWKYDQFELGKMNQDEFKSEFRFKKEDIERLLLAFCFPNTFVCSNGTTASGVEGLCMLLRSLICLKNMLMQYMPKVMLWYMLLAFIDGTVRPTYRPDEHQKVVYNGHKRVHALKYQSVVAANGLIANLYGPVEGRSLDAGILHRSGLLRELK
eukprot:gene2114-biopygen1892